MKKNILLFGALIGAFLLVSCSGGNKKQAASSVTPEELDNASKVINYYHTSLIVLRHVANEEFYKLKYCSTVVYMVPRA